jgi:hypothetical protein
VVALLELSKSPNKEMRNPEKRQKRAERSESIERKKGEKDGYY